MIRISIDWLDGKKFDNLIRYIEDNLIYGEAQEQVRILGHKTADHMRNTINTERRNPKRPDDKLVNAITCETLSTTAGVEMGIGRISTLNAEAPYWEMINDGATYITKKTHAVPLSYFADINQFYNWKTAATGGKTTEGFITFKEGSSHTIIGVDYVGKAIRNLDKELKEMMSKWGAKFLGEMGKASK